MAYSSYRSMTDGGFLIYMPQTSIVQNTTLGAGLGRELCLVEPLAGVHFVAWAGTHFISQNTHKKELKKINSTKFRMSAIVQRLQCVQLPGVHVLCISGGSAEMQYLAHAQQLIGLLLRKASNGAANDAMHAFFKSDAGRSMEHGGDLVTAFCRGTSLSAKIYTHHLGTSKPSYFVTMEGVQTLLDTLPNQDESARQRLLSLLQDHLLDQSNAFQPATDEVDDEDDNHGALALIRQGCVPMNVFVDCLQRQGAAEKQCAEEKLKSAMDIAKLQSEHKDDLMKLQLQLKDEQIAKERMQFEVERKQWELERVRLERDGGVKKQAKVSEETGVTSKPKKLDDARCIFSHLVSSAWPNSVAGVNHFMDLISTDESVSGGPIDMLLAPRMQVRMAQGLDEVNSFYFLL